MCLIYQGIGAKIMSIEQVDLQAPPAPLVFTDAAAEKVRDLLIDEGNPDL